MVHVMRGAGARDVVSVAAVVRGLHIIMGRFLACFKTEIRRSLDVLRASKSWKKYVI